MEKRRPFVVVEGGSGVGKTTVMDGLRNVLGDWKFLREPGGTEFGELMREAVQQHPELSIEPMASFLAYSASRANLVNQEILPVLTGMREEKGVLLDRYWFSSYAYQGSEKVNKAIILSVSKMATGGLMPDLILHFDLLPELALLRKTGCTDIDRYDLKELDFHKRVREGYLELAVKYPSIWKVIDASKTKSEVLWESLMAVRELED